MVSALRSPRRLMLVAVLLAFALGACGRGDDDSRIALDLGPIRALAESAEREAQSMEQHAGTMASAAADRPDRAEWQSEAETVRAGARSLRLLAAWASAIEHDPGARADDRSDLRRIFADGRNLEQLGETLRAHAGAMRQHLEAMRQRSAGDEPLTAALAQLQTDVQGMERSGQGAIERGRELQETARRLAQATGIRIE